MVNVASFLGKRPTVQPRSELMAIFTCLNRYMLGPYYDEMKTNRAYTCGRFKAEGRNILTRRRAMLLFADANANLPALGTSSLIDNNIREIVMECYNSRCIFPSRKIIGSDLLP